MPNKHLSLLSGQIKIRLTPVVWIADKLGPFLARWPMIGYCLDGYRGAEQPQGGISTVPNLSANDVADYLLAQMSEESGDTTSNLKLQKLVYYAQGFYLAAYNKALFREQIKAWDHGPVVPQLWHRFKEHGNSALPKPGRVGYSRFSKTERKHLDEIYKLFDQFSAWKLRNMTHSEPPWKDAPRNGVITQQAMKSYFSTMLA